MCGIPDPDRPPKATACWRFAIDTARDVAIVILAIFNVVQAIVLTALIAAIFILVRKVLQLWPKIETIIDKVTDTTGTVQQTTHTVSSTTTYVAGNVVGPLVKLIAFVVGIRKALEVLFSGPQASDLRDQEPGA